ncbi:MAG TPA: hypothetical protein VGB41_04065, partial [Acidimicrobiia bacterium]
TDHAAFIASGIWRDVCMRQIEYAVGVLGPLVDPAVWQAEMDRLAVRGAKARGEPGGRLARPGRGAFRRIDGPGSAPYREIVDNR